MLDRVKDGGPYVAVKRRVLDPGGTLRLFGWECAAGTLEPLAYTRASSSEFCYPTLN